MLKSLIALVVVFISAAWAQTATPVPSPTTPPKVLLLVYQQFLPGKAGTRQTVEIDIARNFDRLAAPISWIELESLTGPPQALFLDPANSFSEIDKAGSTLAQIYAGHPDLAQSQQQIEDVIANTRTVTAVLRDDLSLNTPTLNLAKARLLRIRVIQVRPDRERDFVNAFTVTRPQHTQTDTAWAAYQVNAGLPDLTFIFFEALGSMQDVDRKLSGAALEPSQLAVAASSETNLYAIHPEMSHVSREFAAADPTFWMRAPTIP
jgi:hypothetical protein